MLFPERMVKVITGSTFPQLAKSIVHAGNQNLRLEQFVLVNADIGRFSDGEVAVSINENIRGDHVFIIQPTPPPADNLLELLVMLDACRRASAAQVTAVLPYFGYARQDRKDASRRPITARLVADMITAAGASRVLTLDLHAPQIQGFFNIPVDHLYGFNILHNYLSKTYGNNPDDLVVVSADLGGIKLCRNYSEALKCDLAVLNKVRSRANECEVTGLVGNVTNKTALIVDDMIDTGGTIAKGTKVLKDHGAARVVVACSHGVFSNGALERVHTAGIDELVVLNTLHLDDKLKSSPQGLSVKTLDVSELFADAISQIFREESISDLFLRQYEG